MSEPHIVIPTRAPSPTSADDTILPFKVEALDLRGRVVRFGPAIDAILSRHSYPAPVAKLLGEGIVLTVLLGSTLKFEGRFILQTQSDGPVRMLVIDYTTGARADCCCSSCPSRRSASSGRTSTPVTCRRASSCRQYSRTTLGSKAARGLRASRTSSCSTPIPRPNGCSTGYSMNGACAFS